MVIDSTEFTVVIHIRMTLFWMTRKMQAARKRTPVASPQVVRHQWNSNKSIFNALVSLLLLLSPYFSASLETPAFLFLP